MYKQDLVLNNLQRLISHKIQPTNQPTLLLLGIFHATTFKCTCASADRFTCWRVDLQQNIYYHCWYCPSITLLSLTQNYIATKHVVVFTIREIQDSTRIPTRFVSQPLAMSIILFSRHRERKNILNNSMYTSYNPWKMNYGINALRSCSSWLLI